MADEAQIRREYREATEYYELIKRSTNAEDELRDINRVMAKLEFSLTDLTGEHLRNEKLKKNILLGLKIVFVASIVVSALLLIYNGFVLS